MLKIKDQGILEAIVRHCDSIERIKTNLSRDELDQDEDRRDLLCFHILQIGELVNHVTEEFKNSNNSMPWQKIVSMRNKVAHGYDTVDNDKVWDTVNNDINSLRKYCLKTLEESK